MNVKVIILGLLGVGVVLYLISKLQPAESQVISQIVPVGSVSSSGGMDERVAFEANKTQAFTALLGLGQSQQQAFVASEEFGTSIELEEIRARADALAGDLQYKTALASYERDLGLGEIQSKTAGYLADVQSATQRGMQRDYLESVLAQLDRQSQAREREVERQIAAVGDVGRTYRNQSLERQGTILNALTSIWGQTPYSYQSSFGGARPPSILQQLFPGGIGDTLKSVFGLF